MKAAMAAEDLACLAHDEAVGVHVAGTTLDERGVVAVRHETDFLAVGLVGGREPSTSGVFAGFVFRQLANPEARASELVLRKRKQEVRLILPAVEPAAKAIPAGVRVLLDARVMAGRHRLAAPRAGAVHEPVE